MVLEFWFCHRKFHFFGLKNGHFWQKWLFSDHKKWHFWWQNQNSKTTFIVQTIPKYCSKGVYFMNLSLLSPILAKFQFCWFSGPFQPFFLVKSAKNKIAFLQRKNCSNKKIEENKSGLEFNFLLKSKCPSLWVLGANLTEPWCTCLDIYCYGRLESHCIGMC